MAALSAAVGLWRTSSSMLTSRPVTAAAAAAAVRLLSSGSGELLLPRTSLSQPPWDQQQQRRESDLEPSEAGEQRGRHAAVVSTVNRLIQQRDRELGRLFAVVQLAGRQWKVTAEDLVLIENHIEAGCGERIRLEKVLLVGAEEFTLLGRPLLGKQLVRVEATVLEKTQSWPKVHMRFWKRHRSERKKIIVQPQTVLRVNSIQLAPTLT